MTNQELIQEAAVIRDERNQYANTAERVGTALVHMAEQLAAQAADVDKIEADVRGALTLSQLDNPFGFTTVAQWAQGLNEDKSYTFRLVEPTTGRCIGHVWLFNDADNPTNSNLAARTLEVVMCCASINADTGALTYNGIFGSPRIYYRSYCVPLTGGTPDGGFLGNGWSAWQEYRDYVAKPIKDTLAALQAKHATDVADLQASIDATLAAIPTGVLNLGMSADADTILAEAAKYAVASDPFKAVITGQYMVGTAVQSLIIHQQVTKNSDGSGVCMQYVFKDKARWTRYVNFNSAGRVTETQPLQSDVPRNLHLTDNGGLSLRGLWGGVVGSGITLPNKNDLREGTPTATSVPLVLTKSIKDTVTCNLGAATTARAGVMTVEQVKQLSKETGRHYTFDTIYTSFDDFLDTTFEESPEVWTNDSIDYVHSQFLYEGVECPFVVYKINASMAVPDYGEIIGAICYVYADGIILSTQATFILDKTTGALSYGDHGDILFPVQNGLEIQQQATQVDIILTGFDGTSLANVPLPAATSDNAGVMTAAHVQKLANLEARIAALEAK